MRSDADVNVPDHSRDDVWSRDFFLGLVWCPCALWWVATHIINLVDNVQCAPTVLLMRTSRSPLCLNSFGLPSLNHWICVLTSSFFTPGAVRDCIYKKMYHHKI